MAIARLRHVLPNTLAPLIVLGNRAVSAPPISGGGGIVVSLGLGISRAVSIVGPACCRKSAAEYVRTAPWAGDLPGASRSASRCSGPTCWATRLRDNLRSAPAATEAGRPHHDANTTDRASGRTRRPASRSYKRRPTPAPLLTVDGPAAHYFYTRQGDRQKRSDGVTFLGAAGGNALRSVGESGCGKSVNRASSLMRPRARSARPDRRRQRHAPPGVDLLALDEEAMRDVRRQKTFRWIFQEGR